MFNTVAKICITDNELILFYYFKYDRIYRIIRIFFCLQDYNIPINPVDPV
jgi:hypothetical protein